MYKLTKHYRKYLFAFECQFDRGEIDPAPIVTKWEETVKDFKDDLDIVESLWKVAIGVKYIRMKIYEKAFISWEMLYLQWKSKF